MANQNILTRGVAEILPSKDGLQKLMQKKKIKVYLGIDPTGTRLHLGHSIALRKLQEFADAGHEAILLFGTGTVLAGDPSQRDQARAKIAAEQIEHNISTWKNQVKNIIDFNKVNVMYNGEWLLRLTLRDVIEIASHISATQLIKRDMFQRRMQKGDTIWTHEILYPLLQGYDSVAMDVDLELGGTDQTFNMLIGRELQHKMNKREKYVLTVPMIVGLDGKPMSKSSGNCVWLEDSPEEMFGKLMSIPDEQVKSYVVLLTKLDSKQFTELHPIDAKKKMAHGVVTVYHSQKDADEAQSAFENKFQKRTVQIEDMEEIKIPYELLSIIDLLFETGLIDSKSQAKRLLTQGAIEVEGKVVTDPKTAVDLTGKPVMIKVGKKRFAKVSQI